MMTLMIKVQGIKHVRLPPFQPQSHLPCYTLSTFLILFLTFPSHTAVKNARCTQSINVQCGDAYGYVFTCVFVP